MEETVGKCLDYFYIEELYGGNQLIFGDFWLRKGGCAAVTACDLCIYFDKYMGTDGLYPYDLNNLSKKDYESFALMMKPYLRPRAGGIDTSAIYLEGFGRYLKDRGNTSVRLSALSGDEPFEAACTALTARIDRGIPVPMLNLKHTDPQFEDYVWHWFIINGYRTDGDTTLVRVASYGSYTWFDFGKLWESGHDRKGCLILAEIVTKSPGLSEN